MQRGVANTLPLNRNEQKRTTRKWCLASCRVMINSNFAKSFEFHLTVLYRCPRFVDDVDEKNTLQCSLCRKLQCYFDLQLHRAAKKDSEPHKFTPNTKLSRNDLEKKANLLSKTNKNMLEQLSTRTKELKVCSSQFVNMTLLMLVNIYFRH